MKNLIKFIAVLLVFGVLGCGKTGNTPKNATDAELYGLCQQYRGEQGCLEGCTLCGGNSCIPVYMCGY
jgi:hypothetical protein